MGWIERLRDRKNVWELATFVCRPVVRTVKRHEAIVLLSSPNNDMLAVQTRQRHFSIDDLVVSVVSGLSKVDNMKIGENG